MTKVNENPSERRESEPSRHGDHGREHGSSSREPETNVGSTPSKAEGEERDVDEALRRDRE